MLFMDMDSKDTFNLNPTTAIDMELTAGGVWRCMETNREKVDDFVTEMNEIKSELDDYLYYNLTLPKSFNEIKHISNGEMFMFYNFKFYFIKDLIAELEQDIIQLKSYYI